MPIGAVVNGACGVDGDIDVIAGEEEYSRHALFMVAVVHLLD